MIPDEKFHKKEHLLKSKDFNRVYKNGRSLKSNDVVIYYLHNELENNRLGFSISASKVRLASRRNRIRRILRELFRRNKRDMKIGYDIIFSVKREMGRSIRYEQLERIFLMLTRETGLLP